MRLSQLITSIPEAQVLSGSLDLDVTDVQLDTRAVGPGSLFCCVPGTSQDGHDFVSAAVAAGAVGVVTERDVFGSDSNITEIRVPLGTMRRVCARLSARIYDDPAQSLALVGITGTNGKTTVAHLVQTILGHSGFDASVIGTLTGARTTPPAPELHAVFAERVRHALAVKKKGAVALEVSSHALDQERVDGVVFDVAVFTNLSPEHLDYHETMEDYFETKAQLFEPSVSRHAVIWTGSKEGEELALRRSDACRVNFSAAQNIVLDINGSTFTWRDQAVSVPLLGMVNVMNALLALETVTVLGVSAADGAVAISKAPRVPGRMDVVGKTAASAQVIVDYAHTPEALSQVLREARDLAGESGKVVIVFGCGGDRDQTKRPVMGAIASELSDLMIVTTDNPRHEKATDIAAQILAGVVGSAEVLSLPERFQAIETAITRAQEGDVVVIAGKGHEETQIIGDLATPFNDRDVALQVMG